MALEMKIIGLAGWSGAGKTTLLAGVLPLLVERGLKVSTIKHAHHQFDIDVPGKDSWRHRAAGASEVLVASGRRFALMHELRNEPEYALAALVARLAPVDLVIVEGYRNGAHAKIEVHRASNGKPLLFRQDAAIVGVVSDVPLQASLPQARLDDLQAAASMMLDLAMPVAELET
jgi:molybdopterin-guanine dinucleotide biosynthesis protein B